LLLEPRPAHGVNRLKSIPYYRWSRHGVTGGLTGAGRVATGVEQAEIRTLNGRAAEEPFPVPNGLVVAPMPSPKRSLFPAVKSVVRRG
jgi:hypothetical protein